MVLKKSLAPSGLDDVNIGVWYSRKPYFCISVLINEIILDLKIILLWILFLLKSKNLYFNLISSEYSWSEKTGSGNSLVLASILNFSIPTSISPVFKFLLIVSFSLAKTLPSTCSTVSNGSFSISLNIFLPSSITHWVSP